MVQTQDLFCCEGTSSARSAKQAMRQSFNRFDDSLVENILSYLKFSDKVLLETVSKLWKKLIYNKQTELILNRSENESQHSLNALLKPIEIVDFISSMANMNSLKAIDTNALKSILKKCKFITKLSLYCFCEREDLNIVGQYCPYLADFAIYAIGLNAQDLDEFGLKYGQGLTRIKFYNVLQPTDYLKSLLIHCKNLIELDSNNAINIISEDKHCLPDLKVLIAGDIYDNDDHLYEENPGINELFALKCNILSNKYSKTLKALKIHFYTPLTTPDMTIMWTNISQFKNLEEFSIYFENWFEDIGGIDEYITDLSRNSPRIKTFKLSFCTRHLSIKRLLYSFENFIYLEDLDIEYYIDSPLKKLEGSVKCLKSCKNLKRLRIAIQDISESFFEDIHIFSPNLSQLVIRCESEISDKTIELISRLKCLKKFHLSKYQNSCHLITDRSVCQLINSCHAIQSIRFDSRPNITNKTIETLIGCAKKYPKKSLEFYCDFSHNNDMNAFEAIDLNSFADIMPQNLNITIVFANEG